MHWYHSLYNIWTKPLQLQTYVPYTESWSHLRARAKIEVLNFFSVFCFFFLNWLLPLVFTLWRRCRLATSTYSVCYDINSTQKSRPGWNFKTGTSQQLFSPQRNISVVRWKKIPLLLLSHKSKSSSHDHKRTQL